MSFGFDVLRMFKNYVGIFGSIAVNMKYEICAHVHIIMPPLNSPARTRRMI